MMMRESIVITRPSFLPSMFFLVCFAFSCSRMGVVAQNSAALIRRQVNVGVVLDLGDWVGKMWLSSVDMALSDFYATHPDYMTRMVLNTRDSKADVVVAAAAALDLIKNVQVQAIIGPGTSMQANFVIDLGEKAQVPIISFSATSPSLISIRSPYFFRAATDDSIQVNALSAIVQAFGWREAVPIYIDNEYGRGIIPYLTDALQAVNTRVPYRSVISPSASDDQIVKELYKLMTMQTRVFVVHMFPDISSRLFAKAKEIGMMGEGYVWIITDGLTDALDSFDASVIDSMQGVIGVKPHVPRTKELVYFKARWKKKFQQDHPDIVNAKMDIYGLRAYDATVALAMAIEKAGSANLGFQNNANVSSSAATDLDNFGVSNNGPTLLQALSNTSFRGITGDYGFADGQLPAPAYQIVNVNGDGTRGLGFWTPENRLVKNLSSASNTGAYSTSNSSLAPVLWPGDSTSVPRGWEIPTNGKKLRIGVPVKEGFSEFVKVTWVGTNTSKVTGYCIDVFDAVVSNLLYALPYEYIPFAKPTDESAGTYDDLVYQVFLRNFDAVVGDTTIIANRSTYVDFTLPYTESGVSMIVPIVDNANKNAWVFLKPLTWDLWVTSFCFFVFIGFVVWILEHRINNEFRGPLAHQAGTSFWFSFSIMVFAHRETLISNLARTVIVIWCFVVLILSQSYTASLTSLLTVQQLQPTVTDVNQLIKNRAFVGYHKGSFVLGILKGLGFDENRLVLYDTVEALEDLLTKGSENGGIAAAFDEVPYIKLFLAKYCSKYTTIEPTFKTDGFGFVFPRGSPLVSDVSRAVLSVTEGDKMKEIEEAWFGKLRTCPDPSTTISSNSLSLSSFWGLFLIAGVAGALALLISVVGYVYEQRNVLLPSPDSEEAKSSIWSRIRRVFRNFDKKDLRSPTFRYELRNSNLNLNERSGTSLPNTSTAPSPSIYSVGEFFGGTNSSEYSDPNPNAQTPDLVMLNIELVNPNRERATATEIAEENS